MDDQLVREDPEPDGFLDAKVSNEILRTWICVEVSLRRILAEVAGARVGNEVLPSPVLITRSWPVRSFLPAGCIPSQLMDVSGRPV